MQFSAVSGIFILLLSFIGCSHFQNQDDGDPLSKQDQIKARQIDTREVNGKLTQTEADLEKTALSSSIKF